MHNIDVSIVYATADKQYQKEVKVARGTNALDLIHQSGFLQDIAELSGVAADELKLGVFAQRVDSDYLLEAGDRLEIYRELTADPKEVRRQLALLGKTMGSGAKTSKGKSGE